METERYVYKIAVAKIILSDPSKYGFYLEESDFYQPFRLERVEIELSMPLSIVDIAVAIGSSYKEIKEMNLHLSGETIPVGTHFINLPPGTTQKFWDFFAHWENENGLK
jgi:membrane-bound lytic murein transglycosylase D